MAWFLAPRAPPGLDHHATAEDPGLRVSVVLEELVLATGDHRDLRRMALGSLGCAMLTPYGHGSNPNRTPSEHPNPNTKIGSKIGGAPTQNGTIGFDSQPY